MSSLHQFAVYALALHSDFRFIARGKFANSIVPDSISVYRFDEEMQMNKSQVIDNKLND